MTLEVCPKKFIRDEQQGAVEVIRNYGRLKQHGVMPAAGGTDDQAPTFVDAIEVLDDETEKLKKLG